MRCPPQPHAALSAPRAFAAEREKPSPPCFSSGQIFLGLEFCRRFPVSGRTGCFHDDRSVWVNCVSVSASYVSKCILNILYYKEKYSACGFIAVAVVSVSRNDRRPRRTDHSPLSRFPESSRRGAAGPALPCPVCPPARVTWGTSLGLWASCPSAQPLLLSPWLQCCSRPLDVAVLRGSLPRSGAPRLPPVHGVLAGNACFCSPVRFALSKRAESVSETNFRCGLLWKEEAYRARGI